MINGLLREGGGRGVKGYLRWRNWREMGERSIDEKFHRQKMKSPSGFLSAGTASSKGERARKRFYRVC